MGWVDCRYFRKRKASQNKNRKKAPLEKFKQSIRTEYIKAKIRKQSSNIPLEHFKCQFGFRKAIYVALALKLTVSSPLPVYSL